jgi:hypothetical protein
MSRHRNIRNMCEDDYYDYDDDYYDDEDYWEEDDNAYYEEQERLRKEQEAARQKAATAKSKPSVAGKKSVKSPTTSKKSSGISIGKKPSAKPIDSNSGSTDKDRVERLVTSMGFSSDMAKEALQKYATVCLQERRSQRTMVFLNPFQN